MDGRSQEKDARRILVTFAGKTGREQSEHAFKPLQAFGLEVLHDEKLETGAWEPQLTRWLKTCDAALALVDMDYLAPGFARDLEVPTLLTRALRGEIAFVPILLVDVGPALDEILFPVEAGVRQDSLKAITWVPTRPIAGKKGFDAPPVLEAPLDINRRARYFNDAVELVLKFFRKPSTAVGMDEDEESDGASSLELDVINAQLREVSRAVLNYSSEIRGEWIEREGLGTLFAALHDARTPHSSTALVGGPGSGKSAALARLAREFIDRDGWSVLAIKVDQLGTSVDSAEALGEELGLMLRPAALIRQLSRRGQRCLVLVDQLDVLADLAGAHPGRLAVILDFVMTITGLKHVHVVLSCRKSEFGSNLQFQRLDVELLELQPLASTAIDELLAKLGIELLPALRDALQTPQQLRLLVEHADDLGDQPRSVANILDNIVGTVLSDSAIEAAMTLAADMGQREQLWLETATLDVEEAMLDVLEGSKLATLDQGVFAFSHQVVFEYFWARYVEYQGFDAIVEGPQTTYVRARLRNALRRQRTRDRAHFVIRLYELWTSPALRDHLRYLILDVVCEIENPGPFEVSWLRGRLAEPDWRRGALERLANPGWFDALFDRLDGILAWGADSRAAGRLLVAGAALRSEAVVKFLHRYWLAPVAESLDLELGASRELWREIAASGECDRRLMVGFLHRDGVDAEFATEVLGVWLTATLNRGLSLPSPTAQRDALSQSLALNWSNSALSLVKAAPRSFLNLAWCPLQRTAERSLSSPARWGGHPYADLFPDQPLVARRSITNTVDLVETALVSFARSDGAAFGRFIAAQAPARFNDIHRLLASALVHAPPAVVLAYLGVEPQRLAVEHLRRPIASQRLLRVIGELDPAQLGPIVEQIMALTTQAPRAPAEARRYVDDALRVGLLVAIPRAKLKPATRAWLTEHEPEHDPSWGLNSLQSMLTPSVQSRVGDDRGLDNEQLYARVQAARERSDRKWDEEVGARQPELSDYAYAIAQSLADSPGQAEDLFASLAPEELEQLVGPTLQAWASRGERERVLQWIHGPQAQALESMIYRVGVARALYELARRFGLGDESCTLLKRWLEKWSSVSPQSSPHFEDLNPHQLERSMIYDDSLSWSVSNNTVALFALLRGLLQREQPAVDEALAQLERHRDLLRGTNDFVAFHFEYVPLFGPQWEQALALTLPTLEANLQLVHSSAAISALAHTLPQDPELAARYQSLIEDLRDADWSNALQAHAELTAFTALIRRPPWALDTVDAMIIEIMNDPNTKRTESLLAGVVHVAGNAIHDEHAQGQDLCLRWLTDLAPYVPHNLARAWMVPLSSDRYAKCSRALDYLPLMQALVVTPSLLRDAFEDVLHAASVVVHESPAHAYGLLNAYIEVHKDLVLSQDTPITGLIGALQRTEGYRNAALRLLETLMSRGVWGVHAVVGHLERGAPPTAVELGTAPPAIVVS